MLYSLLEKLKDAKIPISVREYLTLLDCLDSNLIDSKIDDFYFIAKASLIKDERYFDRFDKIFSDIFKSHKNLYDALKPSLEIPENWINKSLERIFTNEEIKKIKSSGSFEELINKFKEVFRSQEKRHEGGSKWIGTSGTSPFGAYGYNPEGIRVGQDRSINKRAVKIWDQRKYKDLDDSVEIGTRNIKIALRRLRSFARTGSEEKFDIKETIKSTANNAGYLEIKMEKERKNNVKVLLLIDSGGSMDEWVKVSSELFSATRSEFKNLEYFYFHNCVYEKVWSSNYLKDTESIETLSLINKYSADWKLVFLGDASMSPYEILAPGGSVDHWNKETGEYWLKKLINFYKRSVWINPVRSEYWDYTPSINIIKKIFNDKMFPLNISGIDNAMQELT